MKKIPNIIRKILTCALAAALVVSALAPMGGAAELPSQSAAALRWKQVSSSTGKTELPLRYAEEAEPEEVHSAGELVRVSIVMEEDSTIARVGTVEDLAQDPAAMKYRERLRVRQDDLAKQISGSVLGGKKLDIVWNLTLAANLISANVPYGTIEAIRALPGVKDVLLEKQYIPYAQSEGGIAEPKMATSSAMIGSGAAWSSGYTGAGTRVAVIDTGITAEHPSFSADAFEYALQRNAEDREMSAEEYLSGLDLLDAEELAQVWTQLNFYAMSSIEDASKAYVSPKIAFAANYCDRDTDIGHTHDAQTDHGTQVAGIAAANRFLPNGEGFDNALDTVKAQGVAPDAQILAMKVFGKKGGAYESDYTAAVEDAILLGADAINMSFGSVSAGFGVSAEYAEVYDDLSRCGAVVTVSSGNAYSWGAGTLPLGEQLYSDGVNFATSGSPATYTNPLTIASADNIGSTGAYLKVGDSVMFYTESDYSNEPITTLGGEQPYLFLHTAGNEESDFAAVREALEGKIAVVYRGESTFSYKANAAAAAGAIAVIVVNNQSGTITMDLTDFAYTIPCVSITQQDGQKLLEAAQSTVEVSEELSYSLGQLTVGAEGSVASVISSDAYSMSSFSSWGVPGTLILKPELTAPGGSIYCVDEESYGVYSGTSMAAPQAAGMAALAAQYIEENALAEQTGLTPRQLAQSLLMSTAVPMKEASGGYYPVFQQGAGLANVGAALDADSFLTMDAEAAFDGAPADGKVKVELGDDPQRSGSFSFGFTIHNLSSGDQSYTLDADFFTQNLVDRDGVPARDTKTAPLSAKVVWSVNGKTLAPEKIDALRNCDFDGDGEITTADGDRLLCYLVGSADSIACADYADLDADGDTDTYDAYLFYSDFGASAVTVPEGEAVHVTCSVTLNDIAGFDDHGAYVEGFAFVRAFTSADGAMGETHSIPILGYYGSWAEPSMFEVGSYLDYQYGLETREPYLQPKLGGKAYETNALLIRYNGESKNSFFGGNPLVQDETYMPERNAFNSVSGDSFKNFTYTAIRNAGASRFLLTDSEGNTLTQRVDVKPITAAYYNPGESTPSWHEYANTSTVGHLTDLVEGERYTVSLTLAPEYYVAEDGSVDFDALSGNCTLAIPFVVDNTAPQMLGVNRSEEPDQLVLTASDNQYIAAVMLTDADGTVLQTCPAVSDTTAGAEETYVFSGESIPEGTTRVIIRIYDYAMNCSVYKVNLDGEEADGPIQVTISEQTLQLLRGTTHQLEAELTPWGIEDDAIIWSSDDETVAAVDDTGLVTAVAVGECTITAASHADPAKSASCEVSVSALPLTFTGALQDAEGTPQLFSWDVENDSTWSSFGLELPEDICAAAYDANYDMICLLGSSGILYDLDYATGEVLERSETTTALGVPMWDLAMAQYQNSLAADEGIFCQSVFGIWKSYILLSSSALANTFDYGVNCATVLSKYSDASCFVAIAWIGSEDGRDQFFLLCDDGTVFVMNYDGANISLTQYFQTELDIPFVLSGESPYCSMICPDGETMYLSVYTGGNVELYVLEYDAELDTYVSTRICQTEEDVWPAVLLDVTVHEPSVLVSAAPAPVLAAAAPAQIASVSDAGRHTISEQLISAKITPDKAPDGQLSSAAAQKETDEETNLRYLTVSVGATDAEGKNVSATNGLMTVSFDPTALQFVSAGVNADHFALNTADAENGTITAAYANAAAAAAGTEILSVRFLVLDCEEASVTVNNAQINNTHPAVQEKIANTDSSLHGEHILKNAAEPDCEEDGYTGDECCADCGHVFKTGSVIPATGHSPVLVNASEPTATEGGYTGDLVCEHCHALLEEGTWLPPIGGRSAVVTCVVNGAETQIEVSCGDNTGSLPVPTADGMAFTGWFADADFTQPADLSNVQADMTVYGRFTDSVYFGLYMAKTVTKGKLMKLRAYSVIDNAKNYAEYGMLVRIGDGEYEKYVNERLYTTVSGNKVTSLFSGATASTAKMYYKDITANTLADGTEISVITYFVTPDGTTVYGDSVTIVCHPDTAVLK